MAPNLRYGTRDRLVQRAVPWWEWPSIRSQHNGSPVITLSPRRPEYTEGIDNNSTADNGSLVGEREEFSSAHARCTEDRRTQREGEVPEKRKAIRHTGMRRRVGEYTGIKAVGWKVVNACPKSRRGFSPCSSTSIRWNLCARRGKLSSLPPSDAIVMVKGKPQDMVNPGSNGVAPGDIESRGG